MTTFEPEKMWRQLSSNERRRLATSALKSAFEPVRRDDLSVHWLRDAGDLKKGESSRQARLPRYMKHRNFGDLCREIESDGDRNARSVITAWLFTDGFIALREPEIDEALVPPVKNDTFDAMLFEGKISIRFDVIASGRPDQVRFRNMIRQAANGKCEISGVSEDRILEAAHIVALGHDRDDNSVENGLFLTRNLHALFDQGCLWLEAAGLHHIVRFVPGVSCREAEQDGQSIKLRECFQGRMLRFERAVSADQCGSPVDLMSD